MFNAYTEYLGCLLCDVKERGVKVDLPLDTESAIIVVANYLDNVFEIDDIMSMCLPSYSRVSKYKLSNDSMIGVSTCSSSSVSSLPLYETYSDIHNPLGVDDFNKYIESSIVRDADVDNTDMDALCEEFDAMFDSSAYEDYSDEDEYNDDEYDEYGDEYDDEYDEEYDNEYDEEYDEEYDDEYDEEYDDTEDEEEYDEYDEEYDDEYDEEYIEEDSEEEYDEYDEEYIDEYDEECIEEETEDEVDEYDEEYDEYDEEYIDEYEDLDDSTSNTPVEKVASNTPRGIPNTSDIDMSNFIVNCSNSLKLKLHNRFKR